LHIFINLLVISDPLSLVVVLHNSMYNRMVFKHFWLLKISHIVKL